MPGCTEKRLGFDLQSQLILDSVSTLAELVAGIHLSLSCCSAAAQGLSQVALSRCSPLAMLLLYFFWCLYPDIKERKFPAMQGLT